MSNDAGALEPDKPKRHLAPGMKLALELGPLALFFVVYQKFGMLPATAALMVGVVAALLATYAMTHRWPVMPLVTMALVLAFGGLTLFFQDATFIKVKATILYCLFGATLLGALAFGKLVLPIVFDSVIHLTDEGWRQLTIRWGIFFFALAALNELVWRTQSESFWVSFKLFGFLPLTMLFALAQTPLILKHEAKPETGGNDDHI